jgi:hypothetical protein
MKIRLFYFERFIFKSAHLQILKSISTLAYQHIRNQKSAALTPAHSKGEGAEPA